MSLKIFIKEAFDKSTLHTLPNILRTKHRSVAIVHAILLLVAIGFCIWFLGMTLTEYLAFNVITNIKIIPSSELDLPAVTICNKHRADNISYENSILDCEFKQNKCPKESFVISQNQGFFGKCLTINSGWDSDEKQVKIMRTYIKGPWNGLKLIIDVGEPNKDLKFTNFYGIYVIIHNQSTNIQPFDEITIVPVTHVELSLQMRTDSKLPEPYNKCKSKVNHIPDHMFNYKPINLKRNYQYSHAHCIEACIDKETRRQCNCTNGYERPEVGMCEGASINCYAKAKRDIYYGQVIKDCYDLCPIECQEWDFTIGKYAYPLNEHNVMYYLGKVNSSLDYSTLKNRFIRLTVYYSTMDVVNTYEIQHTTLTSMVSNFGGTFGLFLGMSLLSLAAETIEILYELVYYIIS